MWGYDHCKQLHHLERSERCTESEDVFSSAEAVVFRQGFDVPRIVERAVAFERDVGGVELA